ncbi:MAG: hypothetical protein IJ054_09550 [Lachnospiraceae bacterium]|nr:hypothetical protein [Lachnospiraceae bacterium]
MIINQISVGMTAKSSEKKTMSYTNMTLMENLSTGGMRFSENSFSATYERSYEESQENATNESAPLMSEPYNNLSPIFAKNENAAERLIDQLRAFMLEFRHKLSLMIGARDSSYRSSVLGGNTLDLTGSQSIERKPNVWHRVDYHSFEYHEQASMSFETTGQVVTADGRTLEFNLELEMSREYYESIDVLTESTEVIMTDPLIINLDSNPVSVSDQKWLFDIDADGVKDSISLLSKGSGFLCYDKNNDGKINDGRELFGSKTGNGFAELSAYDEDGNGWIDEADSIYDKLSVWLKDDVGNDKIISLREAKLGAIYLGNARTEFALKSLEDNRHNAQVRRSGVFLYENGLAGSIQQVDMAKLA